MMNDCGHQCVSFDSASQLREYLRWSPGRRPSILSHRGSPPPDYPEYCLETYQRAWEYAPCWIEVDIRRTRDGVFVLNHDAKLDRCTTGAGLLSERTYEELRSLRLKDISGRPTLHRMPAFAEVLEWARGRTVVFLDIKEGQRAYEDVLRFVRQCGAHTFCVTLTYCIEDTLAAYRIAPEMVVYGRATDEMTADQLLSCGIPHDRLVAWVNDDTPLDIYSLLHSRGILITYGAFLEADRRARKEGLDVYRRWIENGADIINTDDVPQVAEAIEKFCPA
jgi:glycerophosphoryl diester phosphodiesterase